MCLLHLEHGHQVKDPKSLKLWIVRRENNLVFGFISSDEGSGFIEKGFLIEDKPEVNRKLTGSSQTEMQTDLEEIDVGISDTDCMLEEIVPDKFQDVIAVDDIDDIADNDQLEERGKWYSFYTTCVHKVVYSTCDFSFMNTFCIKGLWS